MSEDCKTREDRGRRTQTPLSLIAPLGGLLDFHRYFCWSPTASTPNPIANMMIPTTSYKVVEAPTSVRNQMPGMWGTRGRTLAEPNAGFPPPREGSDTLGELSIVSGRDTVQTQKSWRTEAVSAAPARRTPVREPTNLERPEAHETKEFGLQTRLRKLMSLIHGGRGSPASRRIGRPCPSLARGRTGTRPVGWTIREPGHCTSTVSFRSTYSFPT